MMCDLDLFYGKVKFRNLGFSIGMDFSETVEACDLKVGRCGQLIEFIAVCEYERSKSFHDLCPRPFTYEN